MPVVNIPNVGSVNFPDSMSHEDITRAIEQDILKTGTPKQPSAATSAADAYEKNLLSPLMGLSRMMGVLLKRHILRQFVRLKSPQQNILTLQWAVS